MRAEPSRMEFPPLLKRPQRAPLYSFCHARTQQKDHFKEVGPHQTRNLPVPSSWTSGLWEINFYLQISVFSSLWYFVIQPEWTKTELFIHTHIHVYVHTYIQSYIHTESVREWEVLTSSIAFFISHYIILTIAYLFLPALFPEDKNSVLFLLESDFLSSGDCI